MFESPGLLLGDLSRPLLVNVGLVDFFLQQSDLLTLQDDLLHLFLLDEVLLLSFVQLLSQSLVDVLQRRHFFRNLIFL